ncbi:MAG: 16S rRNA (uracil(1498)-N(3))-methyltransferase [Chlorobiota bacterium]|jgi:16S rRNA (uracil1498-N3)-methyltransferase|nr:MAG: 16S rRNA (uracil(1498)-N(3))-methyltransferase [Chlorobiota bacterium]
MNDFSMTYPALYHSSDFNKNDVVVLSTEESRHAKAFRFRIDDKIILINGKGAKANSIVKDISKKGVYEIFIQDILFEKEFHKPYIVLVISPLTSKSRIDWCIEKATELGAREILPIICDRTEGRFDVNRSKRIALSAIKQCKRVYLPVINEPIKFNSFIESNNNFDKIFVCYESSNPNNNLIDNYNKIKDLNIKLAIVIGPEGGFSSKEIDLVKSNNIDIISLGKTILRAETASIAALGIISINS